MLWRHHRLPHNDRAEGVPRLRILVVEDDSETAGYLTGGLEEEGHAVSWSRAGRDGLFLAMTENFDLLIIDRMLPELDGLTLVKTLRAARMETPVLFLTTMAGIDDRVTGLNAGGDDYLVKPFAFSELVARVKALSRRPRGTTVDTNFKVADLELDMVKHVVKRAGQEIQLQPREFRLLEYLMRHAGQVVTRTMLLDNVWNYHFDPKTNVVESHLSRLRTKDRQRVFARADPHGARRGILPPCAGINFSAVPVFAWPCFTRRCSTASVLILFGVTYWFARDYAARDENNEIDVEYASILDEARSQGMAKLPAIIDSHMRLRKDVRGVYLLQDAQGRKITGNIPAMAPVLGPTTLERPLDGQRLQIRAHGYRLQNGDYLLVGQDTATLREMNALILRTFAVEIVITLLLAGVGTAIVGTTVLKRVDTVNRTARAIMAGDLSQRVPVAWHAGRIR